ncbi:unnamed protein product [Arabidopsis halleri]
MEKSHLVNSSTVFYHPKKALRCSMGRLLILVPP